MKRFISSGGQLPTARRSPILWGSIMRLKKERIYAFQGQISDGLKSGLTVYGIAKKYGLNELYLWEYLIKERPELYNILKRRYEA